MAKSRKLTIFVGCVVLCSLLAVWLYYATMQKRHYREWFDVINISYALKYYAELYDGNLPNSWDDLKRTNIITPLGGNSKGVYVGKESTKTSSIQCVENIELYQISFGLRPDEITISDSKVLNADGKQILIIRPRSKTYLAKEHYPFLSLNIARAMKAGAKQSGSAIADQ